MRRLSHAFNSSFLLHFAVATWLGACGFAADAGRGQPMPNRPPPIFFSSHPREPVAEIVFWSDTQPIRGFTEVADPLQPGVVPLASLKDGAPSWSVRGAWDVRTADAGRSVTEPVFAIRLSVLGRRGSSFIYSSAPRELVQFLRPQLQARFAPRIPYRLETQPVQQGSSPRLLVGVDIVCIEDANWDDTLVNEIATRAPYLPASVTIMVSTDADLERSSALQRAASSRGMLCLCLKTLVRGGERFKDWQSLADDLSGAILRFATEVSIVSVRSSFAGPSLDRHFHLDAPGIRFATPVKVQLSVDGQDSLLRAAGEEMGQRLLRAAPGELSAVHRRYRDAFPEVRRADLDLQAQRALSARLEADLSAGDYARAARLLADVARLDPPLGAYVSDLQERLTRELNAKVSGLRSKQDHDVALSLLQFLPRELEARLLRGQILREQALHAFRQGRPTLGHGLGVEWSEAFGAQASSDDRSDLALVALRAFTKPADTHLSPGSIWFRSLRSLGRTLRADERSALVGWLAVSEDLAELVRRVVEVGDVTYCRELLGKEVLGPRHWIEFALGNPEPWESAVTRLDAGALAYDTLVFAASLRVLRSLRPLLETFREIYAADPVAAVAALRDTRQGQLYGKLWQGRFEEVAVVSRSEIPYDLPFVENFFGRAGGSLMISRGDRARVPVYFLFQHLSDGKVLRVTVPRGLSRGELDYVLGAQRVRSLPVPVVLERIEFSASRDAVMLATALLSRSYLRSAAVRQRADLLSAGSTLLSGTRPEWQVTAEAYLIAPEPGGKPKIRPLSPSAGAVGSIAERERRADFVDPIELNLANGEPLASSFGAPLQEGAEPSARAARLAGHIRISLRQSNSPTKK
jgi:hypothetical protein